MPSPGPRRSPNGREPGVAAPALRTALRTVHLAAAILAGAVILIMAVTGVLLSLEDATVGFAERRRLAGQPEGGERMAASALVESARRAVLANGSFSAASIRYDADPRASVRVVSRRGERVDLNPYTGAVLDRGAPRVEAFFEGVRRLHRWLAVPDAFARSGRSVTGAANAVLLLLLLTGALLWIPRPFNRRTLLASVTTLRGAWGQARAFNWHKVAGFWSLGPLLVIAASALLLSYPSLGDRLYPVAGTILPLGSLSRVEGVGERGGDQRDDERSGGGSLDAALAAAQSAAPRWRSIVVHIPRDGDAEVRVELRTGGEGQPQRSAVMTVDERTGAVTRWEAFADAGPGRRGQQFVRYAHTGEYWGWAGQAAAALASLGAVCLVWTGVALAWRRALSWRRAGYWGLVQRRQPPGGSSATASAAKSSGDSCSGRAAGDKPRAFNTSSATSTGDPLAGRNSG